MPARTSRPATLIVLLATAALGCAVKADELTSLPPPVQKAMRGYGLPARGLSAFVQDVETDAPLLEFNVGELRNPASVMKVITTLVGLHALGPDFRWRTEVVADARPSGGRLEGNLYLRGGGDPYLVSEGLWKLLRRLRDRGVNEISGDIVIDASFLDPGFHDPAVFDGRPYRAYNAGPSGFLVDFAATRFTFVPDPGTGTVGVVLDPPSTRITVDNALVLNRGRCRSELYKLRMIVGAPADRPTVRFTGAYPATCGTHTLRRVVASPEAHAAGAVEALWGELGGRLGGTVREGTAPTEGRVLFTWRSRPLADVIRAMNKFSNNVMTRQLLLTLGAASEDAPGTVDKGRAAIRDWLVGQGVDVGGLFVDNGSGLSRDVRVSARTLGQTLLAAWASPLMPEFVSSLPLSAVDGTMKKRFRGAPLAGRAHMKTGLIDHVRSIAGFLVGRDERIYVVVVLHNHPGVHNSVGTRVQDALLTWVYGR